MTDRLQKHIHLPLVTAIIVRLWIIFQIFYICIYWGAPQYSDAYNYQKWALDCYNSGNWYPKTEQFYSEPYICYAGYINFLIACLHIFGSFTFVPIINLFLNILQLFALYQICKKICNQTVAYYFTIFYCILLSNISIVAVTTSDLFFMTFMMCSITLIKKNHLLLILSGMLITYANYVRPFAVLYLLPIFFYVLYHKFNWKYYVSYFSGIILMTLLLLTFSYTINGTTHISSTTGGINLIIGANDDLNGSYTDKVLQEGNIGYIENSTTYDVFQKDSIWKSRSIEWIKENPRKYILYAPVKMARLWWADSYSHLLLSNEKHNNSGTAHIISVLVNSTSYYLILIFFCIGIFKLGRKIWGYWGIFLIPLLGGCILHMIMYGGMRYHYPFMPIIIFYAALGLCLLQKKEICNYETKPLSQEV
ncbi:MAG TPA: hypothetical protein IAD09_01270 [Candidatus Caccoplasma merdavium]|nr:hypothetical protein [Candidatus Caccoplasma merdavium]